MKRLRLHFGLSAILAATLALTACLSDSGDSDGKPEIVVRVLDSAGVAFAADTVYWSYAADGHAAHKVAYKAAAVLHGDDTTKKAATRLDAAGTRWVIRDEGLHGAVFIRAEYGKNVDPFCIDHAYTQLEVNADALPKEVALTLKVHRLCE